MTNHLVGVLCRFRLEPVALMCDIKTMFHQFHVNSEHRDLLRFLWWEDGNLENAPQEYRMTVHLFGAVYSPASANFGFRRIACDFKVKYGDEASQFLKRNFYVDDGLKSVQSTEQATELIKATRAMCMAGGLQLHKFASNDKEVLKAVAPEDLAQQTSDIELLEMTQQPEHALGVRWCLENDFSCLQLHKFASNDKEVLKAVVPEDLAQQTSDIELLEMTQQPEHALGVHWCLENDSLSFRVQLQEGSLTRRSILSMISSVYDPLGLASPVLLAGRQILQQICKDKLDWDDPLPDSLKDQWKQWASDLIKPRHVSISRCLKPSDFGQAVEVELHSFSDASLKGYGACCYLRQVNGNGQVHCALVMGKARVTPLKAITVPRLELTAAVTAARLSGFLTQELDLADVKTFYWTDSTVVLGYLNNDTSRFHTYVANRIQTIRDVSLPEQWNHVSTGQNPADLASHGCSVEELDTDSKWFRGPSFLSEAKLPERRTTHCALSEDDPEVRRSAASTKCYDGSYLLDS